MIFTGREENFGVFCQFIWYKGNLDQTDMEIRLDFCAHRSEPIFELILSFIWLWFHVIIQNSTKKRASRASALRADGVSLRVDYWYPKGQNPHLGPDPRCPQVLKHPCDY